MGSSHTKFSEASKKKEQDKLRHKQVLDYIQRKHDKYKHSQSFPETMAVDDKQLELTHDGETDMSDELSRRHPLTISQFNSQNNPDIDNPTSSVKHDMNLNKQKPFSTLNRKQHRNGPRQGRRYSAPVVNLQTKQNYTTNKCLNFADAERDELDLYKAGRGNQRRCSLPVECMSRVEEIGFTNGQRSNNYQGGVRLTKIKKPNRYWISQKKLCSSNENSAIAKPYDFRRNSLPAFAQEQEIFKMEREKRNSDPGRKSSVSALKNLSEWISNRGITNQPIPESSTRVVRGLPGRQGRRYSSPVVNLQTKQNYTTRENGSDKCLNSNDAERGELDLYKAGRGNQRRCSLPVECMSRVEEIGCTNGQRSNYQGRVRLTKIRKPKEYWISQMKLCSLNEISAIAKSHDFRRNSLPTFAQEQEILKMVREKRNSDPGRKLSVLDLKNHLSEWISNRGITNQTIPESSTRVVSGLPVRKGRRYSAPVVNLQTKQNYTTKESGSDKYLDSDDAEREEPDLYKAGRGNQRRCSLPVECMLRAEGIGYTNGQRSNYQGGVRLTKIRKPKEYWISQMKLCSLNEISAIAKSHDFRRNSLPTFAQEQEILKMVREKRNSDPGRKSSVSALKNLSEWISNRGITNQTIPESSTRVVRGLPVNSRCFDLTPE